MRSGEGFGIVRIERGRRGRLRGAAGTGAGGLRGADRRLGSARQWPARYHRSGHAALPAAQVLARGQRPGARRGDLLPTLSPCPMIPSLGALRTVLQGLEAHPHVQRIGLAVDFRRCLAGGVQPGAAAAAGRDAQGRDAAAGEYRGVDARTGSGAQRGDQRRGLSASLAVGQPSAPSRRVAASD
jgi:hypothetical protein